MQKENSSCQSIGTRINKDFEAANQKKDKASQSFARTVSSQIYITKTKGKTKRRTQAVNWLSYSPASTAFLISRASFPSTLMPNDTHVPSTSFAPCLTFLTSELPAFILATFTTDSNFRLPTLLGSSGPPFLPFSTPSSFFRSSPVDGEPTSMTNVLVFFSTITFTGTFRPANGPVCLFISSIMPPILTPRGPSAGPSGGPAVARPPSTIAGMVTFDIRIT